MQVNSERAFVEKRRLDLTRLFEKAGHRPVARPLMNVLSDKERTKIANLEAEGKKRKFQAQQMASLRLADSLKSEEFDEMARLT